MIRRPPRSTLSSSSAASDVYKRQDMACSGQAHGEYVRRQKLIAGLVEALQINAPPTRRRTRRRPCEPAYVRVPWWHSCSLPPSAAASSPSPQHKPPERP